MLVFALRCLLAVLLVSSAVAAQTGAGATVITGATLIDGTGAPPLPDAVVVVENGRIINAGPRNGFKLPARIARRIDARGRWLIPGLVDPHVHFFQSGGLYTRPDVIDLRDRVSYEKELNWIRERLPFTFERYLCSGVTSVVDVGGPLWNFEVRRLANGAAAAPRVAVAGPLLSTYAPEKLQTADPPIIRADTPEEARQLVRAQLARKPDLVKIWYIRRPGMKLEEAQGMVKATIDEAHHGGVRVAVHATQLETAKAALAAGADVLVHDVDDQPVDDEFIRMLKERRAIYTSTMVVVEGYAKVLTGEPRLTDADTTCGDPQVVATWKQLPGEMAEKYKDRGPQTGKRMATMQANLKRLVEAGVIVAAATDAGNIGTLHGSSVHRQYELMAEAGLTPMQVLVAATRDAALVFAAKPDLGTIKAGNRADLVLLTADPLADVRNLRRIDSVFKAGRRYRPRERRSQE